MPRVEVSDVVDAETDAVWELIRPFDSMTKWHPAIDRIELEEKESSDQVGVVRRLFMEPGELTERLLGLSDANRFHQYSMEETPFALENYRARLQLHKATESQQTLVDWSATFDSPDEARQEMVELVRNVFTTGIQGIRDHLV